MNLIEPSIILIEDNNPFMKIERAARICYKSEDKITRDSSTKILKSLVKNSHFAMLEHAAFVFMTTKRVYNQAKRNHFLNATNERIGFSRRYIVSGNLRAINDSGIYPLMYRILQLEQGSLLAYNFNNIKLYQSYSENDLNKTQIIEDTNSLFLIKERENHVYYTFHFITDRGVTHELVRHRLFSFAQESTRYVNYFKDKFGGGNIKFIKPADFDNWTETKKEVLLNSFRMAENNYNQLIFNGATPQEARAVLPNGVKTEIIVTGNCKEWEHYFDLRSKGITGAPHPDMKKVADMAYKIYYSK